MGESVHVQQEQIDLLNSLGYELIAKNVANENNPFEDWWIDPTVVDEKRVKFYKEKDFNTQYVYMFVFYDDVPALH
jgi:hypothetical protein